MTETQERPSYKRFKQFLDDHHARTLWQTNDAAYGTLTAYGVKGRVIIVKTYETHGFEVYVQTPNSVDATIAQIEELIGD